MTLGEIVDSLELDCSCKHEGWKRAGSVGVESAETYLLLQEMLRDAGAPLSEMILRTDENGKPSLNLPFGFSLSHSKGLLVCALASNVGERVCPIGVDVELRGRMSGEQMHRIAERWFSDAERRSLAEDPSEEAFLAIWTGKEAMAKYFGQGLAVLRNCDTARAAEEGITLSTRRTSDAVVSLALPAGYKDRLEWNL